MTTRRSFLSLAPAAALVLPAVAQLKKEEVEDVAVAEDLMREHGVLKRVLLIYDEVGRRIQAKKEFSPQVVVDSAHIIRTFIEDYHEKLEEDHLFPRFRKARKLAELVSVLTQQHQAGRLLTGQITALASGGLKAAAEKQKLAEALHAFVRMYAPHEAREDTVLFPALHEILSRNEFDSLGEEFEDKEHELFGKNGFEAIVDRVAGLEKQLGIYDLAQFTPLSGAPAK
jgi:hemerythrin-like domain-containing protein